MTTARSYRFLAPNLATAANILAGFASILAASEGSYRAAVYWMFVAILLDILDGRLARWLKATSEFGRDLDSFSDALSFGAAPAFLAYQALIRPLGPWGLALSAAYLLAAVFRLARFNLTADAHSKGSYTQGVPTPIAAGYVMAAVLMGERLPTVWAALLVAVMALLMISRVALPELKGRGAVSAALLVGVANYMAVLVWPNWYTVAWWNLWNGVILLVDRLKPGIEETAVQGSPASR